MFKCSLLDGKSKYARLVSMLALQLMETMGDRIRVLRQSKGYSLEELGALLGVTKAAVGHWESGQTKNIKNATMLRLVQALGTSQEYLLFGPDSPKPPGSTGRYRTTPGSTGTGNKV